MQPEKSLLEPQKSLNRTLNRGFAGLLPGIDFANHADDVEYGVRELSFEVYFFFAETVLP